jgi:hypothetical protein
MLGKEFSADTDDVVLGGALGVITADATVALSHSEVVGCFIHIASNNGRHLIGSL